MDHRRPGIRPHLTPARRLDLAARHAMPAAVTLALLLLATAPVGLPGQAQLLPALAMVSVFHWSVLRPIDLSPPVVFVLGLLADLLGLAPVGVMLLSLLLLQAVVLRWRRTLLGRHFALLWASFAAVALAASALDWLLFCLLSLRLLPVAPMLFQAAVAIAIYPALAVLLRGLGRLIADPSAG